MRCADTAVCALRTVGLRVAVAVMLVLTLTSCADGFLPASSATTPAALSVQAVRLDAIRVAWKPVEGDVVSYVIERRRAFTGPFEQVAQVDQRALTELVWIDSDVQPETYYGYRVFAVTSAGDRSAPSVVGGALTPPLPGIDIRTSSVVTVSESLDPDGYEVVIAGPDTVRAGLGVAGTRRVSPLRPGRYTVTISGIVPRCAVNGTAARSVDVTDSTATTIAPVAFEITCRDPSRGELALTVAVTGDSLDNAFLIDVLGQAADTTLPTAERVFSRRQPIERSSPTLTLSNLRPGTYDVRIDSIAGNCALTGPAVRQVTVAALAADTVRYAIACRGSAPPVSSAPFVWRNTWVPQSGPTGSTAELDLKIDLSSKPTQGITGVQGSVSYDPAVLRYDEVIDGQIGSPTVNSQAPGQLTLLSGKSGAAVTGVVTAMKLRFTVLGASGSTTVTTTRITKVSQSSSIAITDSVRAVEDTFSVGTGTAPAANQPPVAQFTGPTTGTVGTAVAFNGTASSDPDGTIAGYAWAFGDNTTATVVSPSKTYTAPGTYTVRLTVTDNRGGTASRTATITIAAAGTPAPPTSTVPVAEANGPYSAQVGVPVTLSSAGSTNATSFNWVLGNGQTATGAAPSVTYAAAGTFTVVLTATSSSGAQSTDQATVIVTAAPTPPPSSATPLAWKNVVQPFDVANNLVEFRIVYDLGANLTETPGPEALQSFVVDSLKWDPALLQFVSINLGPGITGSSNQAGATAGRLGLRGTLTAGLNQGSNIVIANIRFRPVGTAGRTVTTTTFLGPLIGTAAVNFFSYNAKTAIVEGVFTLP